MKNRNNNFAFYLLTLLVLTTISACSSGSDFTLDKSLNIVIEKGEHYNLTSNTYKVNRQDDLLINLNIDNGYYIDSLNYDNCTITPNETGASILLKDIRYDLRLKPQIGKYPSVHLVENENYISDEYNYILKEGNEIDFSIKVNPEKELNSCSYADSEFLSFYDNSVNFHLYNINSDVEVSFSFEDKQYLDPPIDIKDEEEIHMYSLMPKGNNQTKCIFYCLNEGTLIDNENEQYGYYKKVNVTHHPRPNTDIGTDVMKRDGYHLDSWNTKKDGSGVRVGLGSRFTLDYSNVILYARWKKEDDASSFVYENIDDEITITGYICDKNNIDKIVIPNFIDNAKVTCISQNVFSNLTIGSIYLPLYLKGMENNTFVSSSIKELHFYDSSCFNQKIFKNTSYERVFINAVEKPKYCENEFSYFPDAMDRVILNQDNKKLILYGGCSLSYGIVSEDLAKEFPDYVVCNMGIIGGSNSGFQLDCISHYVTEGDLMIHAPEPMSKFQMMDSNEAEVRMFNNVESNYDLLTLVDVKKIAKLFDAYYDYCNARKELEPCKYEDYCDHYNEYGDIINDLEVEIYGKKIKRDKYEFVGYKASDIECSKYDCDLVNDASISLLESYYQLFKDRGVSVVFSFCPIDKNSLNENEIKEQTWLKFEEKVKSLLSYPVISSAKDYILDAVYFFDNFYHLNYDGARLRTLNLINDLKKYLELSNS